METAPKVLEATYTTLDGGPDENHLDADGNPEKVGVGMVDWEQSERIRNETDFEDFLFVRLEGKIRGVILVTSLTKNQGKEDGE